MSGKCANDIAKTVINILQVLLDDPNATSIITWSDNCVPQKRNYLLRWQTF